MIFRLKELHRNRTLLKEASLGNAEAFMLFIELMSVSVDNFYFHSG